MKLSLYSGKNKNGDKTKLYLENDELVLEKHVDGKVHRIKDISAWKFLNNKSIKGAGVEHARMTFANNMLNESREELSKDISVNVVNEELHNVLKSLNFYMLSEVEKDDDGFVHYLFERNKSMFQVEVKVRKSDSGIVVGTFGNAYDVEYILWQEDENDMYETVILTNKESAIIKELKALKEHGGWTKPFEMDNVSLSKRYNMKKISSDLKWLRGKVMYCKKDDVMIIARKTKSGKWKVTSKSDDKRVIASKFDKLNETDGWNKFVKE